MQPSKSSVSIVKSTGISIVSINLMPPVSGFIDSISQGCPFKTLLIYSSVSINKECKLCSEAKEGKNNMNKNEIQKTIGINQLG